MRQIKSETVYSKLFSDLVEFTGTTPIPPTGDWILDTGFWRDEGFWRDDEFWID